MYAFVTIDRSCKLAVVYRCTPVYWGFVRVVRYVIKRCGSY